MTRFDLRRAFATYCGLCGFCDLADATCTRVWTNWELGGGEDEYICPLVAVQHGGSNRGTHSPRPVEPPHITVHFDSGRGTSGVSFGDVKKGRLNWMGDQPVSELLSLGQVSVNLDITWPGYGHLQRSYPLEIISNNRPVAHGYLALQIVKAYERFFDSARKATYGGTRNENGTTWEIGKNYSRMHFVLHSVTNAHTPDRGVFRADIQVLMA